MINRLLHRLVLSGFQLFFQFFFRFFRRQHLHRVVFLFRLDIQRVICLLQLIKLFGGIQHLFVNLVFRLFDDLFLSLSTAHIALAHIYVNIFATLRLLRLSCSGRDHGSFKGFAGLSGRLTHHTNDGRNGGTGHQHQEHDRQYDEQNACSCIAKQALDRPTEHRTDRTATAERHALRVAVFNSLLEIVGIGIHRKSKDGTVQQRRKGSTLPHATGQAILILFQRQHNRDKSQQKGNNAGIKTEQTQ